MTLIYRKPPPFASYKKGVGGTITSVIEFTVTGVIDENV
jgi:hypothetical protein